MIRLIAVLIVIALSAGASGAPRQDGLEPTVILVSFDGWRWDYHTKAPAPHLRELMARGVRAEGLTPAFPAKTFPNHYTIVTGLYPGHHGIVANSIRDPASGRTFSMGNRPELRDAMWWGGEPIWVTAQRAGRMGAAMFWPGSEAPIGGMLPRYWEPYDESLPAEARVDQVLRWLDLPAAERPTFITLYFEDTDTAGHRDGPESQAVRDAITRADAYLGRLMRGLGERGLREHVNIVVVSDHGMAPVSTDRVVVLDDYVTLGADEVVDINPTLGIVPKPGTEEAVYRALAGAHPRLSVYRRAETPPHWQYRDHPRIPPIVGVADEGWQVLRRATVAAIRSGRMPAARGQHGYDPQLSSMRGIFVAAGPAFRTGVTVPAFESVHVYSALAQALGLKPAPNDGDPRVARSVLR